MKLYFFPIAPNPTKVRLYLAEKREAGAEIPVEEVVVNLGEGEQNSDEHAARNPMKRLPALELDDGRFVVESRVMIALLEELHPEPPLVGATPIERALTSDWERLAELEVMGPIARWIHASRSPLGLPPNEALAEVFSQATTRGVALFDERLADGRPFVMGEQLTIADTTLAAALQFARFRELPLPSAPHLERWSDRYRERPAAKAVLVV